MPVTDEAAAETEAAAEDTTSPILCPKEAIVLISLFEGFATWPAEGMSASSPPFTRYEGPEKVAAGLGAAGLPKKFFGAAVAAAGAGVLPTDLVFANFFFRRRAF